MSSTPLKVIVHDANPEPLVRQLQQAHADVLIEPCDSYSGLSAALDGFKPDIVYSIRFAGTNGFPTDALLGENGPQWISVGGSGVDHLGVWNTDKITVTNSAGVAANMMAEYAFGAFLHFSLDVPGLAQDKAKRTWPGRFMTPLQGKTVLIVGLGHTGLAVAKIAKTFGMHVLATRARPEPNEFVDEVHASRDIGQLWNKADFIVVCVPLLESTKNLVDAKAFAAMKSGAILVNVARGGVVDEVALEAVLVSGHLKGAAMDVFETEPLPTDHSLWGVDRLLISPHCSSVFVGWEEASMQLFCENLARWKNAEPLLNIVDPHRGY